MDYSTILNNVTSAPEKRKPEKFRILQTNLTEQTTTEVAFIFHLPPAVQLYMYVTFVAFAFMYSSFMNSRQIGSFKPLQLNCHRLRKQDGWRMKNDENPTCFTEILEEKTVQRMRQATCEATFDQNSFSKATPCRWLSYGWVYSHARGFIWKASHRVVTILTLTTEE